MNFEFLREDKERRREKEKERSKIRVFKQNA
jgi:hypothetical protein